MKGLITVKHKGNFNKSEKFMKNALRRNYMQILRQYGDLGVQILQEATPKDSGETASSWNYKIYETKDSIRIAWNNTNENNGVNIAILLIYGHALKNGGYVQGNDFVTPAMRPLMQELADKAWRGVTK